MPDTLPYVDLQLNGYRGVDFNADDLPVEACHAACEGLQADGVTRVLATIVTAELDRMAARLARIAAIRRQDQLVAARDPRYPRGRAVPERGTRLRRRPSAGIDPARRPRRDEAPARRRRGTRADRDPRPGT